MAALRQQRHRNKQRASAELPSRRKEEKLQSFERKIAFAVKDGSHNRCSYEPTFPTITHPAGSGQEQGQSSKLPSSVSHIRGVQDCSSVVHLNATQRDPPIDISLSTNGSNAAAVQAGPSGDNNENCVRRQGDRNSHVDAHTCQSIARPPSTGEVLIVEPVSGLAQSSVAQKLCDQLLYGIHGCSRAQHEQKLREHFESVGNNHNGLSEVFNNPAFPTVLGTPEMITQEHLDRHQMPSATQ